MLNKLNGLFDQWSQNIKKTYREYPGNFWILVSVYFIDRIGDSLIFPFLALYVTSKFNVGMTDVGILMAIYSGAAFFSNMVGGALTDKFGRKSILIVGLVSSASISLLMGFVQKWETFYFLTMLTGFVAMIGGPAASAMMADILPLEKRTDGYGVLRVAVNLAVTIGPALGGFLAGVSYKLLFVMDFVVSIIAAGIVFKALAETKPEVSEGQADSSILQTFGGYGIVLKNGLFIIFVFLTMITGSVYLQFSTTLSVYLNDIFGTTPRAFGYLLSLNALLVVLFQFPITIWVKKHKPILMMALGNLLYAIGLSMYGYVTSYALFLLAVIIFTLGEMVNAPVVQSLVVNIAPKDMRGRYMAVFMLGRGIALAVGPVIAGMILDNYNPRWLWLGGGMILVLVALLYLILQSRVGSRYESITLANSE